MKIIDRIRALWRKDAEWAECRECEIKCKASLDDELARIESLPIRGAADELARREMVNAAFREYSLTLCWEQYKRGLM